MPSPGDMMFITRVPADLGARFIQFCERYRLSRSMMLRQLMEHALDDQDRRDVEEQQQTNERDNARR